MSHKLVDKLSDLSDITGAPADGQVLTYQASSSDWQPAAAGGGGGGTEQFIQVNTNKDAKAWLQKMLDTTIANPQRTVVVDTVRSSGVFPAGTYRFHYRVSVRSPVSSQFSGMAAGSKANGYQYNFLRGGNILSSGTNTTVYNHVETLGGGHVWDPQSFCIERQNSTGYTQVVGLDFVFTAGDTFDDFTTKVVYGTGHTYYDSGYTGTENQVNPSGAGGDIYSELLIVTKL
jgi:hypothetical protein